MALESSGSYLEIQTPRAHPRPIKSESAFSQDPQVALIHIKPGEVLLYLIFDRSPSLWLKLLVGKFIT